jgi:arsenate reductase
MLAQLENKLDEIFALAISEERKKILQVLIEYIQTKRKKQEPIRLNFICTHNSRRSQFAQIWAQTAADIYGIPAQCYSGGVEVTAFNERAVASIERFGFKVAKRGHSNPIYFLYHTQDAQPIIAFSKVFDDETSAKKGFAAIMTCSHADENCPFIPGAEARIPVRYDDPKAFDDTEQESDKYDERSMQIASEMFYVFANSMEK